MTATKTTAKKPDFRSMLATARLPEKVVPTCLRGDLAAEVELLDAELERVQQSAATSLAGSGAGNLVEQIEALQEQMREHTYPVRLRALPRTKRAGESRPSWQELKAQHPPRLNDDGEVVFDDFRAGGMNAETFQEPMLRASIVDPELNDAEFADLVSALTDQQYTALVNAAWNLNQGAVDVPFSRAASQARLSTGDE